MKKKENKKMKIEGLKVFQVKDWKSDTVFTDDNGRAVNVPANHKIICIDEQKEIVNVSFVTPSPLSVKEGDVLKGVTILGNVSKTSFGWSLKAQLN